MKLIKQEMVLDEDTFKPILRVTIDLDLEARQNESSTMTVDEQSLKLGKEFMECLEESISKSKSSRGAE